MKDWLQKALKKANDIQRLPTMSISEIAQMTDRRNDLGYQYRLCTQMMERGELLPYPFERAVIQNR